MVLSHFDVCALRGGGSGFPEFEGNCASVECTRGEIEDTDLFGGACCERMVLIGAR